MLLVVFSYPNHYQITQLSIQRAVKTFTDIDRIAIIWDDTHDIIPVVSLDKLTSVPSILIPWSNIKILKKYKMDNWICQQLIKLYLDTIIEDEEFIVIDGDVIFNEQINLKNTIYGHGLRDSHPQFNYSKKILGLEQWGFSGCPIKYIKKEWLFDIKQLCKLHNGKELDIEFTNFYKNAFKLGVFYSANEWDIISYYIHDKFKFPLKEININFVNLEEFELMYNDTQNFMLVDSLKDDFSDDFCQKHGIQKLIISNPK